MLPGIQTCSTMTRYLSASNLRATGFALAGLILVLLTVTGRGEPKPRSLPRNIVLIMADDLGIEGLGCYGGTDQRFTSELNGEKVVGGKGLPVQTGIRVPLIASWPGHLVHGICDDLIDPSDFLPTLAALAGLSLPDDWSTDGVSFAPRLLGQEAAPREWAFFWYDPRPGHDKERFSRAIFALDHDYKLYSDGRMFDIAGNHPHEVRLETDRLPPEAVVARAKLKAAIDRMMQPPLSTAARIEVDAAGNPL